MPNLLETLLGYAGNEAQKQGYTVGGAPAQAAQAGADGGLDIAALLGQGDEQKNKLTAVMQLMAEMRQRREGAQEQPSTLGQLLGGIMKPTQVSAGSDVSSAIAGLLAARSQDTMQRKLIADLVGGRIAPISQLTQAPQQGNIQDDLTQARSILESILGPSGGGSTSSAPYAYDNSDGMGILGPGIGTNTTQKKPATVDAKGVR